MSAIRVVLDTNVVVSAHLNDAGYEAYVLDLVFARKLKLAVSAEILEEYLGVLTRLRFGFNQKMIAKPLRLLKERGTIVKPLTRFSVCQDFFDKRFFECAQAARVHYLMTENKRHFPKVWRQTVIVNARELIEWVTPGTAAMSFLDRLRF